MNTEALKNIASWAYPNVFDIHLRGEDVEIVSYSTGERDIFFFNPQTNPSQELHLIRKYREFLISKVYDMNVRHEDVHIDMFGALESTSTLLEAIERDVLGGES